MIEATLKTVLEQLPDYDALIDEISDCRRARRNDMHEELEELEETKSRLEAQLRADVITLIKEAAELLKDIS